MDLFSRRGRSEPDEYMLEFTGSVRSRIMHTISHVLRDRSDMRTVLLQMREILFRAYGYLAKPQVKIVYQPDDDIVDHLNECSTDQFRDILELLFRVQGYGGGQAGVVAINEILEEESIGFELTPFVVIPDQPRGPKPFSGSIIGPPAGSVQYPRVIRKSEKLIHAEVVEPALKLLVDPRFAQANSEFVDGLVHLRKREYDDAIISCGRAIESVLKTICTARGWTYDPHKDTCSTLLDICRKKGLFYPFYRPILEGTATIRNKQAHGKGPNPEFVATKELADHMVHTCCSNILLLVSLAKL